MRTANDSTASSCSGDLYNFVTSLPNGTIDAIVGGHVHSMFFIFKFIIKKEYILGLMAYL